MDIDQFCSRILNDGRKYGNDKKHKTGFRYNACLSWRHVARLHAARELIFVRNIF